MAIEKENSRPIDHEKKRKKPEFTSEQMKEWTKQRKFSKPDLKRRHKALDGDSSALRRWHPFPEKAVNAVNKKCAERDPIAYVLPPKIQFHPLRGPRKPTWNKTEIEARKGVETENIWEDVENDIDFPDKVLDQEVIRKANYIHVYPLEDGEKLFSDQPAADGLKSDRQIFQDKILTAQHRWRYPYRPDPVENLRHAKVDWHLTERVLEGFRDIQVQDALMQSGRIDSFIERRTKMMEDWHTSMMKVLNNLKDRLLQSSWTDWRKELDALENMLDNFKTTYEETPVIDRTYLSSHLDKVIGIHRETRGIMTPKTKFLDRHYTEAAGKNLQKGCAKTKDQYQYQLFPTKETIQMYIRSLQPTKAMHFKIIISTDGVDFYKCSTHSFWFLGIELLGHNQCMPTSVSFAKKKPQSLEWFGDGLDIIVEILDNGITVDKLHHTFEFAYYIADTPALSYTLGTNGHGALDHACAVCEIQGSNITKKGTVPRVWYPPYDPNSTKKPGFAQEKPKLRPTEGENFFKGKIYAKPTKDQKCQFNYKSAAFDQPEKKGLPKDAATNIFYKKMKNHLRDVSTQVCRDSMHSCELNVGRRLISQSFLGKGVTGKQQSKANCQMFDLAEARKIHHELTTSDVNKAVWQRGKLFSRIPREIESIIKWKATEIRVFTQYELDIILACTSLKPPKESQDEAVAQRKRKEAEDNFATYNVIGDGKNHLRKKFLWTYIAGHAILDSPRLIKNPENIRLAAKCWAETGRLGFELWGNDFAQMTVHHLQHLIQQVRHHEVTLTQMGTWKFENFYRVLNHMIRSGHLGLVQFKKRWIESLDVKGKQVYSGPAPTLDTWASIGRHKEEHDGEAFKIIMEGVREENGIEEELVQVQHYTGGKSTIPNLFPEDPNFYLCMGQLTGKWKFKLEDQLPPTWMRRKDLMDQVNNPAKYTAALLFIANNQAFAQPIQHKGYCDETAEDYR